MSEREENEGVEGVIDIRENGVLFRMDLRSGQKTGHYCDQRDNRWGSRLPLCEATPHHSDARFANPLGLHSERIPRRGPVLWPAID